MTTVTVNEVFLNFQVDLVRTLPMDDEIFQALLHTKNIFAGNQSPMLKSKPTEATKASYLLNEVIKKDIDNCFNKLTEAMEEFDGSSNGPVSKLAVRIKSRLEQLGKQSQNTIRSR